MDLERLRLRHALIITMSAIFKPNRNREIIISFGFLFDIKEVICASNGNENSLKQRCIFMGNLYDSDLNGLDCRMLIKTRNDVQLSTLDDLLRFIVQYGDDVFPNLRVGLQILLTVATSIASCERSFSKLKLILSYLRSSMAQERLSALALLSVEREVTDCIDFEEVIDKFAAAKARKISLLIHFFYTFLCIVL